MGGGVQGLRPGQAFDTFVFTIVLREQSGSSSSQRPRHPIAPSHSYCAIRCEHVSTQFSSIVGITLSFWSSPKLERIRCNVPLFVAGPSTWFGKVPIIVQPLVVSMVFLLDLIVRVTFAMANSA